MKQLKPVAVAALAAAAALIAFLGASSASAAVLCKTSAEPCESGQDLVVGDTVAFSLTSGGSAVLKAAFSEIKCNKSQIAGKLTRTGGSGEEVEAEITELSISECKCGERTAHVTVTSKGALKVNASGTVTRVDSRFTLQCTGLANCIYGTVAAGTDVGKFTETNGLNSAEIDEAATLTWSAGEGDSSQFVCAGFGDTATWTASYQVTSPTPLYLAS